MKPNVRQKMNQNPETIQNDVIDLRELFLILKKRKNLIFTITTIVTLISIIYVYLITKPVYAVKTTIELAQIDKKSVENIIDLKEKLGIIYISDKNNLPLLKKINMPKKTKNLLILEAHGYDNQTAEKKLEEVLSYITKHQNKELQSYITMQNKKLALTISNIQRKQELSIAIQKVIDNYEHKLLNISKQDAALAGIYTIEIGKKQTELNNAKNQIYSLQNSIDTIELSISPMKIKKTTIVGKIEMNDHPIKPKKKLTIIVAFITGLMLSIFLAFFLEFILGLKKEEN